MKREEWRVTQRPADLCRALLAALAAADGRRRSRKRDQTPDVFGLSVKRELLQQVVAADPAPQNFEAWLINYPRVCGAPELAGPRQAMARLVFEDWQLAQTSEAFKRWLESGAPSDDAAPPGPPRAEPDGRAPDAASGPPAAIVLTGGRSSRMGRAKALLPFDDQPLITHLVSTLHALFEEIVVVAARDQELPVLPVTVVRDEVQYQGPVGGLYYGLSAIKSHAAFVTSCDAVFLNPRLIAYLLSQLPAYDVVVPSWKGRLQPLHATYRKSVVPFLATQLERGELRPVFLFDKVETRQVSEDEVRRFDPQGWSFFNMNTPDEYAIARERWHALSLPEVAASGVQVTVQLLGAARLVAKVTEVTLSLPPGAQLLQVFAELADRVPSLVGRVITADRNRLVEGYACRVNGRECASRLDAPVHSGDHLIILSADAEA